MNDPIRKFQADLKSTSEQAESLRPVLKSCEDAILRSEVKATVSVRHHQGEPPKLWIMFVASDLKEAVPLLRELAKEGVRDSSKKHRDSDLFGVMAMREYDLGPFVQMTVMLSGGGCRMEQVGTKEVPIMEMRCGSDIDAGPRPMYLNGSS